MAVILVDVIFFVVLLVLRMSWLTISTSAQDTCYSFHHIKKSWDNSNKICQQNGGTLVSMETEEEYQFINKTIQSLNVSDNEWYIGLKRTSGNWKWNSGHVNKTIDKWLPHEPSKSDRCVKIIKHYQGWGLLDDVNCDIRYMFICEYKNLTSELQEKIERKTDAINHTCDINDNKAKTQNTSVGPTSNIGKTTNTTEEKTTSSENVVQPTTSITAHTSTISSTTKTVRKEQSFRIMFVVIALAVSLAVFICIFVPVFCWFRKKSGQNPRHIKSSRNPPKRNTAFNTRSCGQEQRNISNANSESVQIVGVDAVQYAVPVDDIDYPKPSTYNMTHGILYDTDLSTYSEVHDALPPSAKLTSIYYDDENLYLNPVDSALTSDANFYASNEVNSKLFQGVSSKYGKVHQQSEEAVAGPSSEQQRCKKDATEEPASCNSLYATTDLNSKQNKALAKESKHGQEQRCKKNAATEPVSCNSLYATTDLSYKQNKVFAKASKHGQEQQCKKNAATEPVSCNSLYATTDLSSKQNKAFAKESKHGQEQQCKKDALTEPISCNSLYATTDLDSKAYQDEFERTQHLIDTNSGPSFYNNMYACTDLIYFQNKATNEGLEQDGIVCITEDKPLVCKIKASNNGNARKPCHPSIDTIMSASRKSQDTPSVPTPYRQTKGDTMMYAMVDLLNNDKEVNAVYAQVDKKHKK